MSDMHIEENEARTKVIVAPAIGKRTGSLFNQESCSSRETFLTGARCTSWQKAIRIMRRENFIRIEVARDRENIFIPSLISFSDIRDSLPFARGGIIRIGTLL